MSDIKSGLLSIKEDLQGVSGHIKAFISVFEVKISEYDTQLKASLEEIDALRKENADLKDQIEKLSKVSKSVKAPVSSAPPKHIEIDGEKWGVQKKKVGQYRYFYLYKRINKKLHQMSIGKTWDEGHALKKLAKYKLDKKLVKTDVAVPDTSGIFDLKIFAERVLDVARKAPTGHYGMDKFWISHAWKHFVLTEWGKDMSVTMFKKLLLEAGGAGYLALARADLPSEVDQNDLAASETSYLNTLFHFIRL